MVRPPAVIAEKTTMTEKGARMRRFRFCLAGLIVLITVACGPVTETRRGPTPTSVVLEVEPTKNPIGTGTDKASAERTAVATAEEIFRLAAERKFNAMYDRIHPDAHAVVPRAAAVGTFTKLYEITDAGKSEVTGVEIVEWTWAVTGQRYPEAAEVSFEQPYVENGQTKTLQDNMYLVDSGGEWRWFFGNSREFVDTAIAEFGGRGEPLTDGDLLQNVATDLDEFYLDVLSYTDFGYETPGVVLVGEGEAVQTGCGPAESGFWAFYCPLDATVYLDQGLIGQLEAQADFAAAFVFAHEWAHHVQTLTSFERVQASQQPDDWNEVYSIELELMADCFTGAWALDVDTRGQLETDDIDEAVQFTIQYLGDPEYIDVYDPQAHGTADMRREAFLTGYERGFEGCNVVI